MRDALSQNYFYIVYTILSNKHRGLLLSSFKLALHRGKEKGLVVLYRNTSRTWLKLKGKKAIRNSYSINTISKWLNMITKLFEIMCHGVQQWPIITQCLLKNFNEMKLLLHIRWTLLNRGFHQRYNTIIKESYILF